MRCRVAFLREKIGSFRKFCVRSKKKGAGHFVVFVGRPRRGVMRQCPG